MNKHELANFRGTLTAPEILRDLLGWGYDPSDVAVDTGIPIATLIPFYRPDLAGTEAISHKQRMRLLGLHSRARRDLDRREPYRRLADRYIAVAVARGELPIIDHTIRCSKCEEPAYRYVSTDPRRPLVVEPTCEACDPAPGVV